MLRLRTFGSVDLVDPDGRDLRPVLAQPNRLALLVYLAAARPFAVHRRDELLALFWPDLDDTRARDALNQALRFLRQALGQDTFVRRGGEDVGIDAGRFWCDAVAFQAALDDGRPADALELYRGDFLQGFLIEDGGGFEGWMKRERTALRESAARGARQLAEESASGRALTLAIDWGRRALELAPDDERALRRLLRWHDRAGDRAGAFRLYEAFVRRFEEVFGGEPSAETKALVERLRAGRPLEETPTRPVVQSPLPFAKDSAPEIGQRYRIERELGAGGMARVYLARDLKHDRDVALKVMRPEIAEGLARERFVREIRIASRLQHPNIVPLFDSGEADGRLYYVMSLVQGETLQERLAREGRLPIDVVVHLLREIASALAHAHGQGVIHRDIKPANIMLIDLRAVLTDFGIARAAHVARAPKGLRADTLTQAGISVGTPTYMAPEQAAGNPEIDQRADLYALGVVAYEMLAGQPPFTGGTPEEVLAKQIVKRPQPVEEFRPDIPKWLGALVQHCLEKEPSERFQSAGEVAQAIEDGHLRRPVRWRRHPKVVRTVAVLLTVVGAGLVLREVLPGTTPGPGVRPVRRIVVAPFENRTGLPRYDAFGFMAADWITEGLHRTGAIDVVPTITALAAARYVRQGADSLDPVRGLSRETTANLIVTGSVYRDEDYLVVQAQLANADSGKLVGAVEPVRTADSRATEALQELRARIMGLLALSLDDRVTQAERPPTYASYQAFSEGMDAYIRTDYVLALNAFERAHALDSSFVLPLFYASICYSNRRNFARADSLTRIVARQRHRLSAHDRYWLEYREAELGGKMSAALTAIRRAAEVAPASKATYNFAVAALEDRQPWPAESALRRLSPDVGPMRNWLPYWDVLASALHAQGKHRAELVPAREGRRRFPDRIEAYHPEARALAAEGMLGELDRLWLEAVRETVPSAVQAGALAYEIGSELWVHRDSVEGKRWLDRAYGSFKAAEAGVDSVEGRWRRAQVASRFGRPREALELGEWLSESDSTRIDYLGLVGVAAAQLGHRERAEKLFATLAANSRPYSFGSPQYQAGRIALALGDIERASRLFVNAYSKGQGYTLEWHRDPVLAALRTLPIYRQLDARRR